MSGGPASTAQPESFALTPDNLERARTFIARYPDGKQQSAVLAILDLAQRQHQGWLPRAAMDAVAELLGMARIRVYEVATFYSMFNLTPIGEHHIRVCTTTPCQLRGAAELVVACEKALGVPLGETGADGKFTLSEVECLGACVNAPVLQIGDDYFEDLDPQSATAILEALGRGETPTPGPQTARRTSAPASGPKTLLAASE